MSDLELEDRQRLRAALIAIFDMVKAPCGMDEECFRKILFERGLDVVPAAQKQAVH